MRWIRWTGSGDRPSSLRRSVSLRRSRLSRCCRSSAAGYAIVLTSGAALAATAFAFGAMASARHTRIRGTGWVAIAVAHARRRRVRPRRSLRDRVVPAPVRALGCSVLDVCRHRDERAGALTQNGRGREDRKTRPRHLHLVPRDDAIDTVGRIYDHLKAASPAACLDLDVRWAASISQSIRAALDRSDVVLAVIGPRWLACRSRRAAPARRPGDWYASKSNRLSPSEVPADADLVQGARTPRAAEMPAALRRYAYRTGGLPSPAGPGPSGATSRSSCPTLSRCEKARSRRSMSATGSAPS